MNRNELVDVVVTYVSLVKKGANNIKFALLKNLTEDEAVKDLYVPIMKKTEEHICVGVVYAPNEVDMDGDFMSAETLEKTAHTFLADYRNIDINHSFEKQESISILESYITPADFELEGTLIKKGSWILTTKINNDEIWDAITKGELTGYSLAGTARKIKKTATEEVETLEKPKTEDQPAITEKDLSNMVQSEVSMIKEYMDTSNTQLLKNMTSIIEKMNELFSHTKKIDDRLVVIEKQPYPSRQVEITPNLEFKEDVFAGLMF